jgi:hypothetical protein
MLFIINEKINAGKLNFEFSTLKSTKKIVPSQTGNNNYLEFPHTQSMKFYCTFLDCDLASSDGMPFGRFKTDTLPPF